MDDSRPNASDRLDAFFREFDRLFRGNDREAVDAFIERSLRDFDPGSTLGGARAGGSQTKPYSTDDEAVTRDYLAYSSVLNEAGGWYRNTSNFGKSEECFRRALAILDANGLGGTSQYARIVLNLAGLHRYMRRFDEAESEFKRAMEILEGAPSPDRYAIASVMNNIALVYQDQGRYDEALEMSERAFDIIQDCEDADEHEVATELVNIAGIQAACGDLGKAQASVERALEIFDGMEKEDVHHAAALNMLATIRYRQQDFGEASRLFEEALPSVERYFGRNIEYASCLENLAHTYLAKGEGDKARATADEALDLITTILPPEDPRLGQYRELCSRLKGGMV